MHCSQSKPGLVLTVVCTWLLLPGIAFARVDVDVLAGTPFGVGRITVPIAASGATTVVESHGFALTEANGRTLYPAFTNQRVLTFVRGLLNPDQPQAPSSLTVLFLFRGQEPLRLTVYAPQPQTVLVTPRIQPRGHARLLARWWRQYHTAAREQQQMGDYSPIVETYLTTTLGQRLGLVRPLLGRREEARASEPREALDLLMGVESLRIAALKETLLGRNGLHDPADLPVPPPIRWTPRTLPEPVTDVAIEPIAMHVPEECSYIRFGRFLNYLWLTRLMEEHGGDIGRMVTLRGHDAGLNQRLQQQLGLKESALAEVLGEQVISDVALIGRDMFLREGAAMGILFEARNDLLTGDLTRQRAAALKREKAAGATEQTVTVGGKPVSLVSTPDNRLRSFYVADGRYHLVTTSRAIVERFLQVGQGDRPLGAMTEFRLARQTLPLDREDTVFIYLSTAFQKGLMSPQYQIELRRRLQAVTDLELVQLARLAARTEGKAGQSIDELIASGLLPRTFAQRADGSRPVVEADRIVDSLRGGRGTFVPIPDVPLQGVTRDEAYRCGELAAFHQTQWDHMDPLLVGVKRYALNKTGLERIAIDAWLLPFDRQKYGTIASVLGPPDRRRVAAAPDDVIFVQGVMQGGLLAPEVRTHQVFVGLKDMVPQTNLAGGKFLRTLQIITSAPAYLGAWPKPGLLDLLPLGGAAQPDALGYSRFPLGLWRRESPDGFSVLSFHRPILESATPHLRLEEAESDAQLRVTVRDLSQTKISQWLTMLNFQRAYQTSLGNTRFLHALSQQFHLPRQDALATAESLLDVKLVCSLGGQYQLAEHEGGLEHWVSDAWPGNAPRGNPTATDGYQAPLLVWFRGLEADLTMLQDKLVIHAELDMQRKEREKKVELPFFKFFQKGKPKADDSKPEKPKPDQPTPKEPAPEKPRPEEVETPKPEPLPTPKVERN